MNRAGRRDGEAGFTLVEVLVAATMMFAVLFALYAVFDISVRAFDYGGDRVQTVGDARLALRSMEREIRAAYPYDLTTDPPRRYGSWTRLTRRGPRYRPKPASPSATKRRETAK